MRLEPADISARALENVARSLAGRVPTAGLGVRDKIAAGREPEEMDALVAPSISLPHVVYSLGLDAIAGSDPIESAEPTAIRFLIDNGIGYSASAEVPVESIEDEDQAPDITTGPMADDMARLILAAESIDGPSTPFEVRMLRVPALHLSALWLHPHAEAEDIFWLLGEATADGVSVARDRETFSTLLHDRAADWQRQYAESAVEGDATLLGGG